MRYASQFLGSLYRGLTGIHGSISMVQQIQATLVSQGVTLTAVAYGTVGNNISLTVTPGAVAGSEVVSVVGNAITVQVSSGTSTVTQVRTAINSSTAAAALVTATGTSSATVSTAGAASLAGGIDGVTGFNIIGVDSVVQSAVGELTLTLNRAYPLHLWSRACVLKATAQDLIPQFETSALQTTKITKLRLLTGATPTDPTAACTVYVGIWFRNSSVTN